MTPTPTQNRDLVGLRILSARIEACEKSARLRAMLEGGREIELFEAEGIAPEELVGKTIHEAWSLRLRRDLASEA